MSLEKNLNHQVIYNVNNFPIGEPPQNMNQVEAKIAIVSDILTRLEFDDIELCDTLNSDDFIQREVSYRTVLSSAYAINADDLPPLQLAAKYIGVDIELLTEDDRLKRNSEEDSMYKKTYQCVNDYAKEVYEKSLTKQM